MLNRSLKIKKRNGIAIILLLLVSVTVVKCYTVHEEESLSKIGVLLLPGTGMLSHEFTMPVSGAFRVLLQPDADEKIPTVAGDSFDRSTCIPTSPTLSTNRVDYFYIKWTCELFGRFGVIKLELVNQGDGSLIGTEYSPVMYKVAKKYGIGIADFRRFEKDTELQLNITSYLSDTLRERERITYDVIIEPIRIKCSRLSDRAGDDPAGCQDGGW